MSIFTITLPDVGEGVAEAELTEWSVSVGDQVEEDDILAVVMTDKVAVEIPSAVSGKIVWLGGEPGDEIAIGSKFIQIEIEGDGLELKVAQEPEIPETTKKPNTADKTVSNITPVMDKRHFSF